MPQAFQPRSYRPATPDLPPLTWPAPLDALPPLAVTKSPLSPGWADTQPSGFDEETEREATREAAREVVRETSELFDVERGTAFEESLNGLQVRELIGSRLFERLFGQGPDQARG